MKSFLTALKFLTGLPWPRRISTTSEETGRSTPFFPLVGSLLGVVLVFLNRLLEPYLASEILSVVLVSVLIVMTRALHLEGLGDTFERLWARGNGGGAWNTVGDRRIGILGLLGVLVVIVLKFRSLEVMGETRSQGLLLAPVLGRWVMVFLAYGSDSAHGEADRIIMEQVRGRELFFATTLTLILVVAFAGRLGLWIALWVSLFTLLSRTYLHRRLGGVAWESMGAVGEMSEAFALALFASL